MGSTASKGARTAAARKYPARAPGAAVPHSAPRPQGPQTGRGPAASASKDEAIKSDAMDPDFPSGEFSRRLQQMGVVQPNPTYSPSSIAGSAAHGLPDGPTAPLGPLYPAARENSTLSALEARRRLAEQAEHDFEMMGQASYGGRQFIDMRTLVDAMKLLDRGHSRAEVEKKLKIRTGTLEKLGPEGLLTHVSSEGAQPNRW